MQSGEDRTRIRRMYHTVALCTVAGAVRKSSRTATGSRRESKKSKKIAQNLMYIF